jgi:carbohydrate kinase (thermoresistant glucokinase family)
VSVKPQHPPRRRQMMERPTAFIVMGVSGVGKTTTAQRLAKILGWTFRDGDAFHPPANVEKMSAGTPLTDDDRWPWLDAIADWLEQSKRQNQPVIVTCSALKRVYRERLLRGRHDVRIIYLRGSKELIADRMGRRKGHFMPTTLLDSQFATLEVPTREERVIDIDVAMPPSRCVERILQAAGLDPHQVPLPNQKP